MEKLISNIKNIQDKIDLAILRIVNETTLQVEKDAKGSMKGGAGGKRHSAPGEPPYVQSGNLRRNVTSELANLIKGVEIKGKVGVRSMVGYGVAMEFGAPPHSISRAFGREGSVRHPGNLPRPFLRPALAKNMIKFKYKLERAIAEVCK